jgi:urea transport system ATP-binding protein
MTAHLMVSDLRVSFNGFHAVNGMDLAVKKGELRCLIGPNGAGKTTCLDLICGRTKPTGGTVVFKDLTVRENLEVAYCKESGVLRNLGRGTRGPHTDGLESLSRFVDLADLLDEPAAHLSHGQTQWLEIALLLAQDAELILMDEPAAGMTAQETRKTADILNRLKGRHTLIVVEHDMGFVKQVADCISVMHQGKLLAEGSVAEIARDARVREAYLGSGGFGHA